MKRFSRVFEVRYHEINRFKEATPVAMLNYLEEAAISHSSFAGYDMERLKAEGVAWVLNRWVLNMEKYPVWNESIVVETWPSSFERFYATREFTIRDLNGQAIGRASSLWIFLSIEKRRPVRIPENFGEVYGVNSEKSIEEPYRDIRMLGGPEVSREFAVRQADIDTNNHVNNSKYLEWMLEAVPPEVGGRYEMSSLEIEYKKESGYGESVVSGGKAVPGDSQTMEFIHNVKRLGDDIELAVARTEWRKR